MAEFVQNGGSNGGSYASYFSCKLSVWEKGVENNSNYSVVGRKLELISGSSGRFSGLTASWSINVDGQVASGSGTYSSQSYNTAQTIYEDEIIVYHNDDGSKSIACSAVLDFQSQTYSPRRLLSKWKFNSNDYSTLCRHKQCLCRKYNINNSNY